MKKLILLSLPFIIASCGINNISSDTNWKDIVFGDSQSKENPNNKLVFFSIPNVINYAIDYRTDTIYLPTKKGRKLSIDEIGKSDMYAIIVDENHFNSATIETIVGAEAGCGVDFKKAVAYKVGQGGVKYKIKI